MVKFSWSGFCTVFVLAISIVPSTVARADMPDWLGGPLPMEPELVRPPEIEGMVYVKGGCFEMGDTFGDGEADEKPVHNVCIDDFYMVGMR